MPVWKPVYSRLDNSSKKEWKFTGFNYSIYFNGQICKAVGGKLIYINNQFRF